MNTDKVQVFVTPHERIVERSGGSATVAAAARRVASRQWPRLPLDSTRAPEVADVP